MNPDTNELVRVDGIEELVRLKGKGFVQVPKALCKAARLKLGRKKRVVVSRTSGGKLSRWAAKKRRKRVQERKMVEACNLYYL